MNCKVLRFYCSKLSFFQKKSLKIITHLPEPSFANQTMLFEFDLTERNRHIVPTVLNTYSSITPPIAIQNKAELLWVQFILKKFEKPWLVSKFFVETIGFFVMIVLLRNTAVNRMQQLNSKIIYSCIQNIYKLDKNANPRVRIASNGINIQRSFGTTWPKGTSRMHSNVGVLRRD